ncbi:beta-lactamase family protein [Microbacterium sp. LRZ72]|uniref:serine hydrolase domain-containing protein n=1 Tax=Microbacterium sp. LRZ72 TaxID=2942481 RepID=UPI0029AE67AD|nr:serine hydrolase domain-containing protein [Microbacterium sp. LRZ72]MDX2375764.1 beta-lactamase family protein [Microbacterium sp. LRZ72]
MRATVQRRVPAAVAAAALLTTIAACSGPPPIPVPTPTPEPPPPVAEDFATALQDAGVPGGALAIRSDDTTVVYPVGDADAEGTPVTEDTLFAYRSITKSFVVTAALRLADAGTLDLLEPSPDPVPGLAPAGATVRQLAAMTAGIPNYSAQPGFAEAFLAEPERSWDDADLYAFAAGLPAVFPPGTDYEYSNTNTLVLARAIEHTVDDTWAEAVRELVTQPLGLSSVAYPGDAETLPAGAARPFEADAGAAPEPLPVVRASAFSAAGGLYGTAGDLVAWAEALGTGALLDETTFTRRTIAMSPTSTDPRSPLYDAYGLGIGRLGEWIGHTGNGLGYQALAMHHVETGTSVAIVLNATGADPDLPAHLLQALAPDILAPEDVDGS